MAILITWILFGVVTAVVASNKGRDGCGWFLLGVLLGPFGFILSLVVSDVVSENKPAVPFSPDVLKLLKTGDAKFNSYDYDGALADYGKALALHQKMPKAHFNIACLYSIKRMPQESFAHLSMAVKNGFDDFKQIMSYEGLAFLRAHPDFQKFAQEGYMPPDRINSKVDTISQLERLAQLREKGILTDKEFEEQKRKLLA
jgi:hypothetical protein